MRSRVGSPAARSTSTAWLALSFMHHIKISLCL
jgi:hypothetical protein